MSSSSPLRVAVLHSSPIVVVGLEHVLAQHPTRVLVVPVDARSTALDDVDLVLCDAVAITPDVGPSPTELAGRGTAKVVLLAGDLSPKAVRAAMRSGVAAHVSMRIGTDELVDTLEAIHHDRNRPAPDPDGDAPGTGSWPGRDLGLTSREAEVIGYIALGLSNEEIARTLFLSINSVKTYIRNAYRKIGIQRRTQAVVWAVKNGFVSDAARRSVDQRGDATRPEL